MITYNHSNYIIESINSVLSQKTNFPIEIVVGVDNSDDDTYRICKELANKNPETIQLLSTTVKLGPINNFFRTICACTGKYIAILEGDDYWTDQFKLQKQVDFLETNPDYALVATGIILVDKSNKLLDINNMVLPQNILGDNDISFFDLLQASLIYTLTVCLKAHVIKNLLQEDIKEKIFYIIDKWYWLNIAMDHKIRLLDEKTAAYRVHSAGISRNSEFMDGRMPLIRHDVIKKYILNHDLTTLNKADLNILSKSCINLILFKNLSMKKKLDILWLIFIHPVLLKSSMNFMAESIRKKIKRK